MPKRGFKPRGSSRTKKAAPFKRGGGRKRGPRNAKGQRRKR